MKRVFALMLSALMLLGLCACGISEEDQEAIELYEKYEDMIDYLEDEEEAIELYEKYKDLIELLEEEQYHAVIQQMVALANPEEPKEELTPMGELLTGQWYWADGKDRENEPQTLTFGQNGTVTLDTTALTWLESGNSESYISGYLLLDGVHTYYLNISRNQETQAHILQLYSVKFENGQVYQDSWVASYYNQPMLGSLLKSWTNLDENDQAMGSYFYVGRSNASVKDVQYTWAVTESSQESMTIDVGGAYTFTVELRNGLPFGTLCDTASGQQAYYYAGEYDRSWPEYIYPRAVSYLQECVQEQAEGKTPGFYDATQVGESVRYYENDAWKRLYEIFTALGDYQDSAQLVERFTILKDMYRGAQIVRVDKMGNESTDNSYKVYQYNSLGQITASRGEETFHQYGNTKNNELYFFYDDNGRISKIQQGSGNHVNVVMVPAYDDQGRMVSATYESNQKSHELSYAYDDQGRLTEHTVWNHNERYQYTSTYDDQGRLMQEVCWHGWTAPDYKYYRYTTDYTYDAQGFLVEKVTVQEHYRSHEGSFQLEMTTTVTYTNDTQGRPVTAEITEIDGEGRNVYTSQTVTYTYEDLYFFE